MWRFLNTGFHDAFFNMACDEILLRQVSSGESDPAFRVYGWSPPAISFGYAQLIDREVDAERCRAAGIDVVRRVTGGRAVLHWDELTYSVVCRADDPLVGGSIMETYSTISRCLVEGLRLFGVRGAALEHSEGPTIHSHTGRNAAPPCFSSSIRHEIVVGGRKLIGSAQRRVDGTVLQHGSLLIGPAHKRIVEFLRRGDAEAVRVDLDHGTTCLKEILEIDIDFNTLGEALRQGVERTLGIAVESSSLTDHDVECIIRLAREKYTTEEWRGGRSYDLRCYCPDKT
jgi:lipoate-protein ligase A